MDYSTADYQRKKRYFCKGFFVNVYKIFITIQCFTKTEEFTKAFILNVHIHDKIDNSKRAEFSDNNGMNMMSLSSEKIKENNEIHSEYFNRTRHMHCVNEVNIFF